MFKRFVKSALFYIFSVCLVFVLPPLPAALASAPEVAFAPLSEAFLQTRAGRANEAESSYYGVSHLDLSHLANADYSKFLSRSPRGAALPSRYDLRTYGWTTPAKMQSYSNCWAYSACASLESTYLRAQGTPLDLSETHLSWFSANAAPSFTRTFYTGGYDNIAVAMFARWSGAVLECDAPQDAIPTGNADSYPNRLHLENAFFLGLQFQTEFQRPTREVMKRLVYEYGGISAGICMASEGGTSRFYNEANHAWYYNGARTRPDHAVMIAGWDDDYPASSFRADNRPKGNGAWLAKNHRSPSFGDGGFFWVSYEDVSIGDGTVYLAGEAGNFDRNYGHDELGWCHSFGENGSDTIWLANVFTAGRTQNTEEKLEAVSLYATANNAEYEILIYTNLSNPADPSSGTAAASQRGGCDFAGYHTIRLANPVVLPAGKAFAVAVRMTTPGYGYPGAVETAVAGYSDNAAAKAGESFISTDGHTWRDAKAAMEANVCVRAFTTLAETPDPDPDPDPDGSGGGGCAAGCLSLLGILSILSGVLYAKRR